MTRRPVILWMVLAALSMHLLTVAAPAWVSVGVKDSNARDFASFYYAAQVAEEGGDPYDRQALNKASRSDGARKGVHPFFYPPPFVAAMSWVTSFDLMTAYRIWFWFDELALLAAALVLWRWWGRLDPMVGPLIVVCLAVLSAAPNNHIMGQMNAPALALALAGLWQDEEERPWLAGLCLGLACMWKMSPALLVAWCLLRGRWRTVAASCLTAVLVSAMSVPWVSLELQQRFYLEVLPGFGSGDYNGLAVSIGLFGNHSIPNLWHQAYPGTDGGGLSEMARWGATWTNALMVVALGAWFAGRDREAHARACQVGAVCVAMLLIPVYTYEHHLLWALPAVVASAVALMRGRLGALWLLPLALAYALWAYPLASLKEVWLAWDALWVRGLVQEAKFASLFVIGLACVWAGRGR